MSQYRIGQGADLHRLVEGRPLILCGIEIPHEKGLLGHSDADVALHAVMDSLLSALALGDIGTLFPDNDPQYKGADSKLLLKKVYDLVEAKGYRLVNLSLIVSAEKPKLGGYRIAMQESLAELLHVEADCIGITFKTGEGLGDIGEEKAISSSAICLLERSQL